MAAWGTAIPATTEMHSHLPVSAQSPNQTTNITTHPKCHSTYITYIYIYLTLSNLCSFLILANPPQKRELPRTRRRLERMDPKREYFTTWIFLWWRASNAIISSVAFPHVAFSNPPTASKDQIITTLSLNSWRNQGWVLRIFTCWTSVIRNLP